MRLKIEKINKIGTSLVVQWLRLKFLMPGAWVQSLIGELRSHMLCSMAKITTVISRNRLVCGGKMATGLDRRHRSLVGSIGALEPSGLIYILTDHVTLVGQVSSSQSCRFSVAVYHIPASQSVGKSHGACLVTVTVSVAAVLGQPHRPSVNKLKDSLSSCWESCRQEALQGQCLWGNASSKDSPPHPRAQSIPGMASTQNPRWQRPDFCPCCEDACEGAASPCLPLGRWPASQPLSAPSHFFLFPSTPAEPKINPYHLIST